MFYGFRVGSERGSTHVVCVCVCVCVCVSSRSLILFEKHFSERLKKLKKFSPSLIEHRRDCV